MRPPSDIEVSDAPSVKPAGNESHVVHYLRAQAHADAQRYEEALEELLKAVKLKPDLSEFLTRVRWSLELWPAEAKEVFKEVVKAPPNLAGAYHGLGRTYTRCHAFKAAVSAFQEAVRIDPKFADGHYGLAGVLLVLKQIPAGINALLKAEEYETDPKKRDIINSTLVGLGFDRKKLKRKLADKSLAEYNLSKYQRDASSLGETTLDNAARLSPAADYGRAGVEVGQERTARGITQPATAKRVPDDAHALLDQLSPFLQTRAYDKRSEQDPDVVKQMRSAVNRFNYERRKGAQFTEEQTETVAKLRRIVSGHDYHLQKKAP